MRLYSRTLRNFCGFSVVVIVFFLGSCSGLTKSSGSGTGQGGNPTLMFTLRAAPLKTPANVNLLSFRTTVEGISLTPAAGGSVNVPLNANLYQVDLVRLQSDATLLALSTAVPVGSYTNMVVSLSDPAVTYCMQTHAMAGCETGRRITLTGCPATPTYPTSPPPPAAF